jgi:hypothetical protein
MVAEHDRAEEPEPIGMLVAESVHERLVELVVTTRVTVPAKPLIGTTVIVEGPATLALTVTLVGLALMVKS